MFDFGIGGPELLVIAVIAIIIVGPKDLPKLLRTVGQFVQKIRGIAREFQGHLDDAARETGLDEVKDDVNKMTNFTVTDLDKDIADFTKEAGEIDTAMNEAGSSTGDKADDGAGKAGAKKAAPAKKTPPAKAKTPPAKAKKPSTKAKKAAPAEAGAKS